MKGIEFKGGGDYIRGGGGGRGGEAGGVKGEKGEIGVRRILATNRLIGCKATPNVHFLVEVSVMSISAFYSETILDKDP